MRTLTQDDLENMVYGGAVLGAGGGGSIERGLEVGRQALEAGEPRLADISSLPDEAILVTISGVGAVGINGVSKLGDHHLQALELFMERTDVEIGGFLPSEVGPGAVTYGWRESVQTGIPIIDAPCNGRAHPTGLMGSLGLHKVPGYTTTMTAVGGSEESGIFIELTARGDVQQAARIVREAASRSGGSVAVVRNPASVEYVRKNAAVGALEMSMRLGAVVREFRGAGLEALGVALGDALGGQLLAIGEVRSSVLREEGGYTIGEISVQAGSEGLLRIPVCNEYMMVLRDNEPLYAFPDLISLIDESKCLPLGSASVEPGARVGVFWAPSSRLQCSSTMQDLALLPQVESMLGLQFPQTLNIR